MVGIFPFAVGFLGSLHCLGMCGPLVLAYSLYLPGTGPDAGAAGLHPWRRNALHHLAFHAGRVLTYGFLGALAAGLSRTVDLSGLFSNIRGGVTCVAGIATMLMGLVLLKVLPFPAFRTGASSGSRATLWNRVLPPLLQSRSLFSRVALGLAAGFLPCGLSWAMVVTAAATGDPLKGFLTMTAFGLGTLPALLSAGVSSSILSMRARLAGERVAALSVIAMGLFLLYKGAGTLV
jgi:uncharacterized protein